MLQPLLSSATANIFSDLYNPQNVESLRCFFDYFMKDINNYWRFTPRVRLSVLNHGGRDIVNRPEQNFFLSSQKSFQLFLDGDSMSLQRGEPDQTTQCVYEAKTGSVSFSFRIPHSMEFVGPSKLRLFVEVEGSDDMDIFAVLEKYNSEEELQESTVIDVGWLADDPKKEREALIAGHKKDKKFCSSYFSSGPLGSLRISHRALDEGQSSELQPIYSHTEEQLLKDGEVVSADIEIWPYGWSFDAGDILRLTISGFNPRLHLRPTDPRPKSRNNGKHVIHTGGATGSYLLLPLSPC